MTTSRWSGRSSPRPVVVVGEVATLEIGDLVVEYRPAEGVLGIRPSRLPAGAEAWFTLPAELLAPLGVWLADQGEIRREWGKGDAEPKDVLNVVDSLHRTWCRRPASHLWERADGHGGVRTWRELTIAYPPLVEAGGRP